MEKKTFYLQQKEPLITENIERMNDSNNDEGSPKKNTKRKMGKYHCNKCYNKFISSQYLWLHKKRNHSNTRDEVQ